MRFAPRPSRLRTSPRWIGVPAPISPVLISVCKFCVVPPEPLPLLLPPLLLPPELLPELNRELLLPPELKSELLLPPLPPPLDPPVLMPLNEPPEPLNPPLEGGPPRPP